jgi:hypothetical protein
VLTEFTMTANRSARTSSSPPIVPMRAPVALLRRTDSLCAHQRQYGTCCRCPIPHHRLIELELVVRLIVSPGNAIAQFAIAHRHR